MTTLPSELPISFIHVEDRQRKDLGNLTDLTQSIRDSGLIHPIVIAMIGDSIRLVAGGRRLASLKQLGHTTLYHGTTCDPNHPGFVLQTELSDEAREEIELEENIRRKSLTWQERTLAIGRIHAIKSVRSALDGDAWGVRETADLVGFGVKTTSYTLRIAQEIKNEPQGPIAKAESYTDALKLLIQRAENEAYAEQLRRKPERSVEPVSAPLVLSNDVDDSPSDLDIDPSAVTIYLSQMLHNCSFEDYSHNIPDASVPIALLVNKVPHKPTNIERVLKPNSYMVLWIRWQDWSTVNVAPMVRQHWPLIWNKLTTEVKDKQPYMLNYDVGVVACKGLDNAAWCRPTSVVSAPAEPDGSLPFSVVEFSLCHLSLQAQNVLMPYGGPALIVARLGRRPIWFEPDKERYEKTVTEMKEHYENLCPGCVFA